MPDVPAPKHWTVSGKMYPVSRLTPVAIAEIQNLIAERTPDPRETLRKRIEGLPDAVAIHIWDAESGRLPEWPPSMGSVEAQRVWMSRDGQAVVVYHACRKGTPNFTREQAHAIVDDMDGEDFEGLISLVMPAPGEAPKAEAPTTGPA